jgi:hypothetical protein
MLHSNRKQTKKEKDPVKVLGKGNTEDNDEELGQ